MLLEQVMLGNLIVSAFAFVVLIVLVVRQEEMFTRLDELPKRWRRQKPAKAKLLYARETEHTAAAPAAGPIEYRQLKPRVFEPSSKHERPVGDLEHDSISRWNWIPLSTRAVCVKRLQDALFTPDNRPLMNKWIEQRRRGVAIGSDNPRFHFSTGMAVRNLLREVLKDDQLPGPNDMQNWDNFYYGAIHAATLVSSREA